MDKLQPEVLVHHEVLSGYGLYRACPCMWVLHGMLELRSTAPKWCRPVAVFSNLDSQEIHPSWRELPLRVLPLGVDLNRFTPPRRRLVCAIVGRLAPEKVPLDFAAQLKQWDPGPWRIRFIGDCAANDYRASVRDELAILPWVEFVGDILPADIPNVLQSVDAVLIPTCPSVGETGCYTAVEALAVGLPIVCRDVEGSRVRFPAFPAHPSGSDLFVAFLVFRPEFQAEWLRQAHFAEDLAELALGKGLANPADPAGRVHPASAPGAPDGPTPRLKGFLFLLLGPAEGLIIWPLLAGDLADGVSANARDLADRPVTEPLGQKPPDPTDLSWTAPLFTIGKITTPTNKDLRRRSLPSF